MSDQLNDLSIESFPEVATILDFLAKLCYNNAFKKGFWDDEDELIRIVKENSPVFEEDSNVRRIITLFNNEKIALEMSELAERLEVLRKDPNKMDEHCPEFMNVEIEVADLLIRALDFAGRRRLRIGEALMAKMSFNSTREHKHGKKF